VPDRFGKAQLRTVQRLVKKWRARAAHQLIENAEMTIRIEPFTVHEIAMGRVHPPTRFPQEAGVAGA
jgi:hypothetical protein